MLNSKFDINSSEWIERVFENRNKNYGAYELRRQYSRTLSRALAIVIFSVSAIVGGAVLLMGKAPESVDINKGVVNVNDKPLRIIPEKTFKKVTATAGGLNTNASATKHKPTSTTQPVIAANGGDNNHNKSHTGTPVESKNVDVKPLPVGGATAWANFLETNLHYPEQAREQRIGGKVWVSFIVERDGHISNIAVNQPAGHGFDEEAVRVIKLSPVWAPGLKGGQAVRVKYSLPINFNIQHR